MHSIRKTLQSALKALDAAGVDYALIGGLAMGGLGVHRATADVDLLVDGERREVAESALLEAGFQLREHTSEVLHFSGVGVLDVLLANREPTRNMIKRAKPLRSLGVKCVCAEDIIGLKIQAYTNNPKRTLQDKADIAALIHKYPDMDWDLVKSYADLFDQWPAIEAIRKDNDI